MLRLKNQGKPVIIFDFDGTIADIFAPTLKILSKDLQKYNRVSEHYNVRELRMMSIGEIVKFVPGAWYRGPLLILKAKKKLSQMMDKVKPIKGMTYTLRTLTDEGFDLLIVTSNKKENVETFLRTYDLQDMFSGIVETKGLFKKAKRLEETIKKLQLHKDEVIYVGDEIRDVAACHEIGIKIIAVTFGFNSREGLVRWQPDYIVSKPVQILDIVEKLQISR